MLKNVWPVKVRREIERSAETRPAVTPLQHHHRQALPTTSHRSLRMGGARSGRSQPRRRTAPHDSRSGIIQRLQPTTLALRLLAVVVHGEHGRDLASPVSTLLFFRPPALSYQGGVSCEAPRRYRTPHGVLCVRMFVTSVATRKWSPRCTALLPRRVSPCDGLQVGLNMLARMYA